MKVFPRYDLEKLANVDYRREMTLLGLAEEKGTERVVAVAHYQLDEESMTAELDFAVLPEYGHKGIASVLLQHVCAIAKSRRVHLLKAYISPGNERTFGVFQKLGYVVRVSLVRGIYEIRVHLREGAQVCLTEPGGGGAEAANQDRDEPDCVCAQGGEQGTRGEP
jgi:GNAT superfamily N-acetyltransferase